MCPHFYAQLFVLALSVGPDPALPSDDPLANRDKDKRTDALKQFGGDRKTEQSVADGLAWLAAHQRPDGIWDRAAFDRLCPEHDRCSQTALRHLKRDADVGVSALAALAFLGAGYTHEQGPYAKNLSNVFSFILAQQHAGGSFSPESGFQIYNDALAAIAIAEAHALTKDPILKEPLQGVVAHLSRCQQPGGGWDYRDDVKTGRNDTSITGWVLMALKSAQAAGIDVPVETRFRIMGHFDNAIENTGRVWYADRPESIAAGAEPENFRRRYGPAMVATGLYAQSAFGFALDRPPASRQAALLLGELPDLDRLRARDAANLHTEYYWYYGTLAMFNVGGKPWEKWNAALRKTVMEYQERPVGPNGRRHSYGSWPAFGRDWGKWGRTGSRIYSTAINTLTLEIYYRYVPAYLSPEGIISPAEIRRRLAEIGPSRHREILALARRLHPDVGEPVLLDLLDSADADVSLDAALELAALGSPMCKAALDRRRAEPDADKRRRIEAALKKLSGPSSRRNYGKITEIDADARMFLFETAGHPVFYGERVAIIRDGREIGAARVNRRFTAHQAAAARIEESVTALRPGDLVETGTSQ